MKRALLIFFAGIAAAALGYAGVYHFATAEHCEMVKSPAPELAWLKQEFHLSDLEYQRISRMHDEYLRACAERCRLIDSKNEQLSHLLSQSNALTPEVEQLLNEAGQLRADCQKAMIQHFFEVSRTMPPEQGKRYLAWIQQKTVLSDTHSTMHR